MAKKNSQKNYAGKSYTATKNGKTKSGYQGAVKKDQRVEEKSTKTPILLTDTSGVDGYFRPEIAVSRWKLGYEVFMGNFMKFLGLNIIMLLFMAPLLILLFIRTTTIYSNAASSPFSANMGVGYFPFASMLGLEESIIYGANYNFFMWMPFAALVLGVGISGGMYVTRNLCWGENVPVIKTFFQGIKKNLLSILASVAIYSIILAASAMLISKIDLTIAVGGSAWYFVLAKIALYVLIAFSTLHFLAMCSITVTYMGNFFLQMKNCLIFTVVLLPLNAFFGAMALLPFGLLFFGSEALSLALILIMFLGASFTMLVWTVYSQWIYDRFIQDKVQSYKASAEEINKHNSREKEKEVAKQEEGYREVGKSKSLMDGVAPVTDYDVQVNDLDEVFTRDDLAGALQSKDKLK